MAASKKKRFAKNSESDSENSDGGSDQDNAPQEMVNVDFEAYSASDNDFHGIKQLLLQLFLKAHIDVSQFTDILIQQNHISSVIKNATDEDEHMDDDDDDDIENFCFGVTSVVNITRRQDVECIKQLKAYLLSKCQAACSSEDYESFKAILENEEKPIGFIVNERLLNIPAQISLPVFEALRDDIDAANRKEGEKKFNFANFLLISKVHNSNAQNNGLGEENTVLYVNSEEELFSAEASFKFTFLVSDEQDTGLDGKWEDDDAEWQPGRQVMLIPVEKLGSLINKMKTEFS